jgi:hypothetical protein
MKVGRVFYVELGMMREGYLAPDVLLKDRTRVLYPNNGAFEARWDNAPQEAANG